MNIIHDITSQPLCCLSIIFFTWTWSALFCSNVIQQLDIPESQDFTTFLTKYLTNCCHTSFLHFLFEVGCIWHIRELEASCGSFFILKYSLLLFWLEFFAKYIMNVTIKNSDLKSAQGLSGIIMSWYVFNSIQTFYSVPLVLFGLIKLSPMIASLFVFFAFFILLPQNLSVVIWGGFTGILLGFHFLLVLTNWYWSINICVGSIILLINVLSLERCGMLGAVSHHEIANNETLDIDLEEGMTRI